MAIVIAFTAATGRAICYNSSFIYFIICFNCHVRQPTGFQFCVNITVYHPTKDEQDILVRLGSMDNRLSPGTTSLQTG